MENKKEALEGKIHYFNYDEKFEEHAKSTLESDSHIIDEKIYTKYEEDARRCWDIFFKQNKTNFYKDRHYIDREFGLTEKIEELKQSKDRRLTFLEIGCAVGNTMFPISQKHSKNLMVFGFDFSKNAITCVPHIHVITL